MRIMSLLLMIDRSSQSHETIIVHETRGQHVKTVILMSQHMVRWSAGNATSYLLNFYATPKKSF